MIKKLCFLITALSLFVITPGFAAEKLHLLNPLTGAVTFKITDLSNSHTMERTVAPNGGEEVVEFDSFPKAGLEAHAYYEGKSNSTTGTGFCKKVDGIENVKEMTFTAATGPNETVECVIP